MNLDSLSFALSQISYSVTNLSKKNQKASVAEISHLVARHGGEADRQLFRCLFSHINFNGDSKNPGRDFYQIQYLIQEVPSLISKSNFVAILCFAIDNPLHHQKSLKNVSQLFSQLANILHLNIVQDLAFSVALLHSQSAEVRAKAAENIKEKLPNFIKLFADKDTDSCLKDLNTPALHLLLTHLIAPAGQNNNKSIGLSTELKDKLVKVLQTAYPEDKVAALIAPLLYSKQYSGLHISQLNPTNSTVMSKGPVETSIANMLNEVGCAFTSSVEECRNTLMQIGVRELTPHSVARIVGMMVKTSAGVHDPLPMQLLHGDSRDSDGSTQNKWNIELFAQVLCDIAPHLSWRDVVAELDYPGFIVPGKVELRMLMTALFTGIHDVFPIEILYGQWKNTEGQLSWITQALQNPDVMCLADYHKATVQLDMLKTAPDEENRDISTWKSLGLVEALLRLTDSGHHTAVFEIFKFPIQHCPDMLVLALLQITSWNSLKYELISTLIPTFLSSHANSAIVLHYAWHCQGQSTAIRTVVMHSMAEWYMRAEPHQDQARLSRILDVAQDLKALSMLLNATPYAFVIDLACLASRREFLKLDKWLTDKMREHKEPFVRATANFLKRRCPQLMGPAALKEDAAHLTKSHQLPTETLGIMLHSLQIFAGNVTPELSELIMTMITNANVLMKTRQLPAVVPKNPAEMPAPQNIPGLPNPTANPGNPVNPMDPLGSANAAAAFSAVGQHSGPHGFPPAVSAPFPVSTGGPAAGLTTGPTAGMNAGPFSSSSMGGFPSSNGSPFPTSLSSINSTPASPAKSFPPAPAPAGASYNPLGPSAGMSAQAQQALTQVFNNPMQNLANPLPGAGSNPGSIGSSMGLGSGSVNAPSLGGMGISNIGLGGSATGTTPGLNAMGLGTGSMGLGPTGLIGSGGLNVASRQPGAASGGGIGMIPNPVSTTTNPLISNNQLKPTGATENRAGSDSNVFQASQQFTAEVEEEANSVFQKIFNHNAHSTLSIEEVLEMLKKFKESQVQKERDVFGCMLRNLFEEYRFFPQYPDRELHTTAVLFGGIIEQGLVTYMDLGIALRYVLEALKKPHNTKMYFFGVAALDKFKSRLKDYPQYCQHLSSIPHFQQFPAHLIEYINHGGRSAEPPSKPQGPIGTTSSVVPRIDTPVTVTAMSTATTTTVTSQCASITTASTTTTSSSVSSALASTTNKSGKPSIANATNIDTLLAGSEDKEDLTVPPENIQDKVFFIFNNLSLSNIEAKTAELSDLILKDEYCLWLAQYMVMKRSSIEPNFHNLYATFIDHLKNNQITNLTITETYRNIKVLLRSDKGVSNFSDRSLLKNLGHWIGMLTLAKNKPILHNDIDLKSLLYEAYYKGAQELLYVVPFVAKVLESCAKSKVFRPPNPWTMAIMNALAELHSESSLKLNLKFEIEVLCKTLNIDIADLNPGDYLRNPDRLTHIDHQLSNSNRGAKELSTTPQPEEPMGISIVAGASAATAAPMGPVVNHQVPPMAPSATLPGHPASAVPTQPTVPGSGGISAPTMSQFSYDDLNVLSMSGLTPHITINENLGFILSNPNLKQLVQPAIEKAIQDLLMPVVERSIKVALTTCEQIVKKDFALDPEEGRIRAAAHHMARNMTAGMALITCREPLIMNISNNLKNAFTKAVGVPAAPQQVELIEKTSQMLAQDNTELACAFIQKTAVEKARPEMDKRLAAEFDLRKQARNEGRRYCDPVVLTYQAERMPEQIRLKVGGVTAQQIAVYDEFARNIPGFLSGNQPDPNAASTAFSKPQIPFVPDEIAQVYDKMLLDIDTRMRMVSGVPMNNPQLLQLQGLRNSMLNAHNLRDTVSAQKLLLVAVEGLIEGISSIPSDPDVVQAYKDCHIMVLKALQTNTAYGPQWTNKHVTKCLMELRDETRYNLEAVELLIRNHLVNMQQYDVHLAQAMEKGLNYHAVMFSMQLVQRFCVDSKHSIQLNEADFYNTIETLARISQHSRQVPDGLVQLVETIRAHNDGALLDRSSGGPTSMMHSGISQAREFDDPPGLHDKTEFLLREWVNMYHSPAAGRDSTKAFSAFVGQMHQQGILRTDDLITRFFRLCTEMCVDLCYRALAEQTPTPTIIRAKCFHTLDAFVRLIALLVKHSGDTSNSVTKINLLNKVLGIVAGVLLQDHEVRHEFQQLPYHRIFIMLFIELNAPERVLESINFQVLTAFCNTFHILRPAKAPGFSYAWLELVSHRVFIGRMLAITPQQRVSTNSSLGWNMYAQLLIDLFKYLTPFLRNAELVKSTQLLYKGTLRVLLVLLHDFPEFLCDFHYAFCDVIPPNCIQMRNLILSAFPRNMRLPDPFTPNLKVDKLAEINIEPHIMTNFAATIQPATFKSDLDSYLDTRSPVTFLSDLRCSLQVSNEPGVRYNISLINALVLYVGTQAIAQIHQKGQTPSTSTIAHSAHMDIFQNLAVDLDTEGRYLFLNAISNQLRYPNSHTHYFSCTILYLFAEANTEAIQEQITRVLLERLIVNRPHPWGLLITFIELIKNPSFKFWEHDFVHCAPEIHKLFESVARSCTNRQNQNIRETETATTEPVI